MRSEKHDRSFFVKREGLPFSSATIPCLQTFACALIHDECRIVGESFRRRRALVEHPPYRRNFAQLRALLMRFEGSLRDGLQMVPSGSGRSLPPCIFGPAWRAEF